MIFNIAVPQMNEPVPVTTTTPTFTYTGRYEMVDEGLDGAVQNWNIRFLTSGTLKFTDFGGAGNFDAFLVGGGGAGARGGLVQGNYRSGGQGGGGGYTQTKKGITLNLGENYYIDIGEGGVAVQKTVSLAADGEPTSAFGYTANGGKGGAATAGGGDGGNGGGLGGYNSDTDSNGRGGYGGGIDGIGGQDGGVGNSTAQNSPSSGQGRTTREYGEADRRMYACGGSGSGGWRSNSSYGRCGAVYSVDGDATIYGGMGAGRYPEGSGISGKHEAQSASANTGGGGGGSNADATPGWGYVPGNGGSGIVCLRNAR